YCTDTNHIPQSSLELLAGLDTLVLGALRHSPHPTHFNLEEALEVVQRLQPRSTRLTHISHDLDHGPTSQALPADVELAYDGLRLVIDPAAGGMGR
ncbi:MAG: MBL fold metallo-hydrolase, partial [Pirellulales bacterium]|nr:MBL fold metallo-hydrolase [Pirellulales bacterium]